MRCPRLPWLWALLPLALSGEEPASVSRHIARYVDSRLAGLAALSISMPAFSRSDQEAGVFQRNPSLWCADLVTQLTCVSPEIAAGTLISPRHVLFSAHFSRKVGDRIRFIAPDDSIVSRTITAILMHPDYRPDFLYPDISVAVLDEDVPPEIAYARVLPGEDWSKYFTGSPSIPVIQFDQRENITVADLRALTTRGERRLTVFQRSPDPQRSFFFKPKGAGDSSHPSFLVINRQLVLLAVFTAGDAGAGTALSDPGIQESINLMMRQLGGGPPGGGHYQLTPVDLSGFAVTGVKPKTK